MKTIDKILAILLLLALPGVALAQWEPDGMPVCQAEDGQSQVRLMPMADGHTLMVWRDARPGAEGLYGQRLDAQGNEQWIPDGLPLFGTAAFRFYPALLDDGAGGAFVASNWFMPGGDWEIVIQRIDGDGNYLWGDDGVRLSFDWRNSSWPSLAPDGAGGVFVAWQNTDYSHESYLQRVDGAGEILWVEGGIKISDAEPSQTYPQVLPDGAGGVYLAWTDSRASQDVYVQRFDADGIEQWAHNGVLIHHTPGSQSVGEIVPDGAGGIIVPWLTLNYPYSGSIHANRINFAGQLLWGTDGILVNDEPEPQTWPMIAADGAGGAFMCWKDERNGGGSYETDVYAQRIDADGNLLWNPTGVPVCTAVDAADHPAICADGEGGVVIAWNDDRNNNPSSDLYAQRLDGDGLPHWTIDGELLCGASGHQDYPRLLGWRPAQGVIIGWEDGRYGANDVYAQRVWPDGEPQVVIDPGASIVEPWDSMGQALVSPGTASGVDLVSVMVMDDQGWPVEGSTVSLVFLVDCDDLCLDPAQPVTEAVTDPAGMADLDPAAGGCDFCTVEVWADDVLLRSFSNVVSPDWDGDWADGQVDAADRDWLLSVMGSSGGCGDLDGDGLVGQTDLDLLDLAFGDANSELCEEPPPAVPDPAQSSVTPADGAGQVLVSPGTMSGVDVITVTVRDASGAPIGGVPVTVTFDDACPELCIDPSGPVFGGTTDAAGQAYIDPAVGGCADCTVTVHADEVLLRTFSRVVSTDWDGVFANGRVDADDFVWFQLMFQSEDDCADYDGNGLVDLADVATFQLAFTAQDANSELCEPVEPPSCDRLTTFESDEHGWTALDPVEVDLHWESTGGNPGGYLRTVDASGGSAVILGPASFHGDWSGLDGVGIVSLDHVLLDADGHPVTNTPWLRIGGPAGGARYQWPETAPEGQWYNYRAAIDSTLWTLDEGTDWLALLADVQELRLGRDITTGHDTSGLDDFYVGLPAESGEDCNLNGIPDECDTDADGNGVPDDCTNTAAAPDPWAGAGRVELLPAHPNPFNPSTTLRYRLGEDARVDLAIFDVTGRRVRRLHSGESQAAGEYSLRWDGRDDHGERLSSGVYFCRLGIPGEERVTKLTLIK